LNIKEIIFGTRLAALAAGAARIASASGSAAGSVLVKIVQSPLTK
jgi:O-acetylhomoserine/O-acetylserine sulfhydrylase-like pyridoxal-dependent enzyme